MVKQIIRNIIYVTVVLYSLSLFSQNKQITTIKATYYHDKFENRRTSSGEKFSQKLYTAAHRSLPFNTIVRISNPKNNMSVYVKINDRCRRGGIIDLSKIAAKRIDLVGSGMTNVNMEIMPEAYVPLWQGQQQMYAMFDSVNMPKEDRQRHIDSLARSVQYGSVFDVAYYVKIATVETEKEASQILYNIPAKYSKQTKVEKVYNEHFYSVSVGPFFTKEAAETALTDLKKRYASAHLNKRKKN